MNKFLKVGPGGVKCSCCFPAPGTKNRKYQFKKAKKKEKMEALRVEKENSE